MIGNSLYLNVGLLRGSAIGIKGLVYTGFKPSLIAFCDKYRFLFTFASAKLNFLKVTKKFFNVYLSACVASSTMIYRQ